MEGDDKRNIEYTNFFFHKLKVQAYKLKDQLSLKIFLIGNSSAGLTIPVG